MLRVILNPGLPGGRWACLRPVSGHDEAIVLGTNAGEGVTLLDRLLVADSGTTVTAGAASQLPICDVDRLLAGVYATLFGDGIESRLECGVCGKGFELQFSLGDLVERVLTPDMRGVSGPDADGAHYSYRLSGGVRFRLPTPLDQREVSGLETSVASELFFRRCILEGTRTASVEQDVEAAVARIAPVLRLDVEAVCAECGASETVWFNIEAFLLGALARERRWLYREVHTLAIAYRWSPDDILRLSREERRAYVALIQAERSSGQELFS